MNKAVTPDNLTPANPALHSDKWRRISPASVIYFVMKFITGVLRGGLQSVAPVAAVLATTGDNRWFALGLLAAGAAVLLMVGAVLSYLNFKFRVDRDAFLIRSGVLTRKRLTLTFERIQNVAFREPIYFRPFNLVVLTLESAGSTSEEVNLAGIPRPLAETIRRFVLERKKETSQTAPVNVEPSNEHRSAESEPTANLLRQPVSELARYGVSNNNVWVFAGLTVGALGQFDKFWESSVMRGMFDLVGETVGTSLFALSALAVLLTFGVLLILMFASVVGAVIVNYNFHLSYTDGRYHRTRGLFERQETSVPETKIQSLKIAQPVIASLMNRSHLTFNQVGFERKQNQGRHQKFIIPSVQSEFYHQLSRRLFSGTNVLEQDLTRINGKFIFRHIVFSFGLPSLLAAGISTYQWGWQGLFFLVVPLIALPFVALRKRRHGYLMDGEHAVVRSGLFGRNLTVFPLFKAQSIKIIQSPGQRKAELASLKIKLAGQSLTIPYMDLSDARTWRSVSLQQIDTRTEPWM